MYWRETKKIIYFPLKKGLLNILAYFVLQIIIQVKDGHSQKSYGLFVAEMLNFPQEILQMAQQKLIELEAYE